MSQINNINATAINDPVGRIEGHMGIKVQTVGNAPGKVVAAEAAGTLYRGFENILYNRPVQDCINFTQRI